MKNRPTMAAVATGLLCAYGCYDRCKTDNGGCGDPTYWTCVNNVGAEPTCEDVDECATDNGGCGNPTYRACVNNLGAEPTCADVDECATDNGGCGNPTYRACVNNFGAEPTCEDVDECSIDNGGCGDPTYWACVNNPGAEPICEDIDECSTDNGGCGDPTYWACVNNPGAEPTCEDIDGCGSGWSKETHNWGVAIGVTIVDTAWFGINETCDRLEEFETFVINSLMGLELPPRVDPHLICAYSGIVEGTLQTLDEYYVQCGDQCAKQGRLIGEISALAYCEMSFALGGLATGGEFVRAPVQFCGSVYQIGCDLTFNTVTRGYVDDMWDDPETPDVHEGICAQYTDGGDILDPATGKPMWEPVWNQVRETQCAYVQPDDDD
jgi:hypothetical protein